MRYTLTIKRYGRLLTFNTLEALREELGRYFTPKEKASGIVERLTDYERATRKDGYWENSYQDMSVCFYPEEESKGCGSFNSGLGCFTTCEFR